MSSPRAAGEPQNFFKLISSESDRMSIFKSLVAASPILQIKVDGAELHPGETLTMANALRFDNKTLLIAKHSSGPKLVAPSNLTIVFEIGKSYFFSSAILQAEQNSNYSIYIRKLFELQRRNSFRVSISQTIAKSFFAITFINGNPYSRSIILGDLSAGGMSLLASDDIAALLRPGVTIEGLLHLGTHAPVSLKALCKHQRKTGTGKTAIVQAGCQFVDVSATDSQKVAFLVNDYHRLVFARLARQ